MVKNYTFVLIINCFMLSLPVMAFAEASISDRRIVAQQYDASCGLASLATLMTWAGVKVGEKDLLDTFITRLSPNDEKKAQINDKGLSAGDLSRLAASYGFEARWKKQTIAELAGSLIGQPLLIYTRPSNDSGHFSIAEGSDQEHLFIADSILGRYKKTKPEFETEFIVKDGRGFVMSLQKEGRKTIKSDVIDVAAYPALSERLIYISRSLAGEGRFLVGFNFQYGLYSKMSNFLENGIHIAGISKQFNESAIIKYGITNDFEVGVSFGLNNYYDISKIKFDESSQKIFNYSKSSMFGLLFDFSNDITNDKSIIYNGQWNFDEDGRTSVFSGGLNYFFPISEDYYMGAGALASFGFFDEGRKTHGGELQASIIKYITSETAVDIGISYHISAEDDNYSYQTSRGVQAFSSIMFSISENLTVSPSISFGRSFDQKRNHVNFGISISKKFPRSIF